MTIHQCPKCELRFEWKTELDDHCWHDHPEFRHEYPASAPPPDEVQMPTHVDEHPPEAKPHRSVAGELAGWLTPARRRDEAPTRPE
jgi:hypothetical protein